MQKATNDILKDLDGWVEVFLFDPITLPFIKPFSRFSKNPLVYTFITVIITFTAVYFIFERQFLIAAILYFFSIFTDGIDGKIARFNQNKIIIHGILDVMTDQIRNAFYLLAIYLVLPDSRIYILIFLLLHLSYEFTFAMRLELKTRYFKDQPRGYSLIKLKSYYEKEIKSLSSVAGVLISVYNKLFNFSSRYRTYPFPTIVDAEFILFIVFVLTQNTFFAVIALVFMIPDWIMSIFLTLTLAIKLEREYGHKNK